MAEIYSVNLRGPPGGPGGTPLPGNPGGGAPGKPPGGKPPKPAGGGGPPTPAAGPPSPIGNPRPAGLLIPGPAASVGGTPPGTPLAVVPNRADGSAGGGPSTEHDTTCVPRRIVRPNVLFSSVSTNGPFPPCGPFACLRLTLRNSSVSARTRFICCTSSAFDHNSGRRGKRRPYRMQASVRSFVAHRSMSPASYS